MAGAARSSALHRATERWFRCSVCDCDTWKEKGASPTTPQSFGCNGFPALSKYLYGCVHRPSWRRRVCYLLVLFLSEAVAASPERGTRAALQGCGATATPHTAATPCQRGRPSGQPGMRCLQRFIPPWRKPAAGGHVEVRPRPRATDAPGAWALSALLPAALDAILARVRRPRKARRPVAGKASVGWTSTRSCRPRTGGWQGLSCLRGLEKGTPGH